MNNEEKILELLEGLTKTVAQQGEQLAQQGARMGRMEERMDEMQETLTRVAVTQESVVLPQIQLALEGHSELKREIGTLASKQQVEELAGDVDIIKKVVTCHSSDISELKKAQ